MMVTFFYVLAISSRVWFRRFPARPINWIKGVLRKAITPLQGRVIQASSIDEVSLELYLKGLIRFLTTREEGRPAGVKDGR